MLPRAVRSPCWRTTKPFIRPACVAPRATPTPAPWRPASYRLQSRVFTSQQGPLRAQVSGDKTAEKKTTAAGIPATPESKDNKNATTTTTTTKKNDLLSEATVGAREQRKADWAIMKEMAKYLWPKVRADTRLLESFGRVVNWIFLSRMTGEPSFALGLRCRCWLAQRYVNGSPDSLESCSSLTNCKTRV